MSKQKIREWLVENYAILADAEMADIIHQYTQEQSGWVSVDSIDLVIGDRWLCELNGEPIVLELDRSFPSNNEPYYFWFEPYMNDLEIEWDEVTRVAPLPPTEEA